MPDPGMPGSDPLLVVPLRLYLLCCLVDVRWRTLAEVAAAVEGPVTPIVSHVTTLRWAGYVETRGEGCRLEMRLTAAGAEQLSTHIAALETVVGKAARLSARARRSREATETVPVVEANGRTWFLKRAEVRFAEADGDNVRLHTPSGVHSVRVSISWLARAWGLGFIRVHRKYLVALAAIVELRRNSDGGLFVQTDCGLVPVSRRRAPALRGELLRMGR